MASRWIGLALLAGLTGAVGSARAADLTIGVRIEPVMDPHLAWSASNLQFYRHYLGFLADIDPQDRPGQGLAEAFSPVSDTIWDIKLRPALKFNTGAPVTAADVIASIHRARTLPNAIGTYAGLFAGVTSITAPDDHTVRIETASAYPTLPSAFTQIAIVPKATAESAVSADFRTAKANAASGPYSFVQYVQGTSLALARNPDYWGQKARWDHVTFRFIPDPASRVAALLAGEVDAIDGVPPDNIARIKGDPRFSVFTGSSDRATLFLGLDLARATSPSVTDAEGKPLTPNPLQDVRVRRALALAIDRPALRDTILNGAAFVANQLLAEGFGGYSKAIPQPVLDRAKATELLRQAGYPQGFSMHLGCPGERYVNSVQLCLAVAQMFTHVGVKTSVDNDPYAVFLSKARSENRPAVFLLSWSAASSGEADVLKNVVHSYDPQAGLGTWNFARYSNPEIDRLIEQSQKLIDSTQRFALEAKAMEMTMADEAVIPLYTQAVIVAARKGLSYTTYADESTTADAFVAQ